MLESDEVIYDRFLRERINSDFAVLFERHRSNLLLFVTGIVHNIWDAEDIMMDAFATAAAGPVLFEGRSSFKTWLYGIARNKALMYLRKHRHESGPDPKGTEVSIDEEQLPEFRIILSERNRSILKALENLNEDYRNALYLAYFEDMTHDQVCKVLKKNKKQVYNLINRGKERLRDILKDVPDIL